jgi:glucose/arabinose dehydrogenase
VGDNPFANRIVRIPSDDFSAREDVISGLPVSGHNHGTNDLEFGPDGRLFISQGGMTSSGAPSSKEDPRWRDWDETPLSGAILVADVRSEDFDGALTYDSAEATSQANLLSGDVDVYSPGHRNTFDIEFHSNGLLYSVDNGSSEPVPSSIDCETLGPPPENDPDQLNVVDEGAYYGHANRNRGRFDERQCENISPFDERPEAGMLKLMAPSVNSLMEINSGVFPESWNGDLLVGWWSGGELTRMVLAEDGRSVVDEEIVLKGMSAPISMVQDPRTGMIYVAEFAGGSITYLSHAS